MAFKKDKNYTIDNQEDIALIRNEILFTFIIRNL